MYLEDLLNRFDALKRGRRTRPGETLRELGHFSTQALELLGTRASPHGIAWQGPGDKTYSVYSDRADDAPWSRAVNDGLFIGDPDEFSVGFRRLADRAEAARGALTIEEFTTQDLDRLVYTAAMSFAVATDLYNPSRGLGGTYFEMIVGPVISLLTNRVETGDVELPVPGGYGNETVKVDLTFHDPAGGVSLAVPTKISTRERISQAFVHARILETARPGGYRTVLCVINENNAFITKGARRSRETIYLRDTLVPKTIALYQRYVAKLDGLYYLDPPQQYLSGTHAGLPPVNAFGHLLTGDLNRLLSRTE